MFEKPSLNIKVQDGCKNEVKLTVTSEIVKDTKRDYNLAIITDDKGNTYRISEAGLAVIQSFVYFSAVNSPSSAPEMVKNISKEEPKNQNKNSCSLVKFFKNDKNDQEKSNSDKVEIKSDKSSNIILNFN